MTIKETLAELKRLGTAQNRKVYGRHGVSPPMFGVSYANLGKLKKRIKQDHSLALLLWESGNHDARVLATMVADPDRFKARELDTWMKEADNHVLSAAVGGLTAQSSLGMSRAESWRKSRSEWKQAAGWYVTRDLIAADAYSNDQLNVLLKTIESTIHQSPNRCRYNMNSALVKIGLVSAAWEKKALSVARRIGKVTVDHGETGCKTPNAITAIPAGRAKKTSAKKKATRKKKAGVRSKVEAANS